MHDGGDERQIQGLEGPAGPSLLAMYECPKVLSFDCPNTKPLLWWKLSFELDSAMVFWSSEIF
jgi:hypothetical protein